MYLIRIREILTPETRLFHTVGIPGAFTTYSTFAYESYGLIASQRYPVAVSNVALHFIIGLGAVAGAIMPAKAVFK